MLRLEAVRCTIQNALRCGRVLFFSSSPEDASPFPFRRPGGCFSFSSGGKPAAALKQDCCDPSQISRITARGGLWTAFVHGYFSMRIDLASRSSSSSSSSSRKCGAPNVSK
mmetsp:Transcript_61654/g.130121  ORF Transcript_61654/g.130121 Transcript_61654/m.130121 type:complete len:111 (+) Transcript_61654:422-754(+)